MILFPNAKINLGLNITQRRSDGYHEIETLFYPIGCKDIIEVVRCEQADRSPKVRLFTTGIEIDAPEERNLMVRAYHLLDSHYRLPACDLHLWKIIPFGAGLGGGSADAAFTLIALNRFFDLGIDNAELAQMAQELGADCPFFVYNTPLLATGIGTTFTPTTLSLEGYHLCLVKPAVNISTAEAYANVTPQTPAQPLAELLSTPIEKWRSSVINQFEESLFPSYPLLAEIKEELYRCGALYASMSGSGSSLYGIFREPTQRADHFAPHFVWEGKL